MKQYLDLLKHVYSFDTSTVESSIYKFYIFTDLASRYYIEERRTMLVDFSYNPYCSITPFYKENNFDYEALIKGNLFPNQDSFLDSSNNSFFRESLFKLLKVAKKNLKLLLKHSYKYLTIDIRSSIRTFVSKIVRKNTEEEHFVILNNIFLLIQVHFYLFFTNDKSRTYIYNKYIIIC